MPVADSIESPEAAEREEIGLPCRVTPAVSRASPGVIRSGYRKSVRGRATRGWSHSALDGGAHSHYMRAPCLAFPSTRPGAIPVQVM